MVLTCKIDIGKIAQAIKYIRDILKRPYKLVGFIKVIFTTGIFLFFMIALISTDICENVNAFYGMAIGLLILAFGVPLCTIPLVIHLYKKGI